MREQIPLIVSSIAITIMDKLLTNGAQYPNPMAKCFSYFVKDYYSELPTSIEDTYYLWKKLNHREIESEYFLLLESHLLDLPLKLLSDFIFEFYICRNEVFYFLFKYYEHNESNNKELESLWNKFDCLCTELDTLNLIVKRKEVPLQLKRRIVDILVYEVKSSYNMALNSLSQYARSNITIMECIMSKVLENLYFAHDNLKYNRQFMSKYLGKLFSIELEIRNSIKEQFILLLRNNKPALKYANDELKNDKEIILEAVKQYQNALNLQAMKC